jgi:hypothetical protein
LVRILLATLTVILCSCNRFPDSYSPPKQFPGGGPNPDLIVDFGQPEAATHIVKDIDPFVHVNWVLTGKEPTLKILAISDQNMKLLVDFTLLDDSLRKTGPIELTFQVNGKVLDKIRYERAGNKRFEKDVPADWLIAEKENTVAIGVDKLFPTDDGTKYGFILSRVGFTR